MNNLSVAETGHFLLCLAWLLALSGVITGLYAGAKRSENWFQTTKRSSLLVSAGTVGALVALGYAFFKSDYSLQYVWQYSNSSMEPIYRVSAIWGGMDGSMLLWCAMLTVSSALVAWHSEHQPRALMPWVLAVMNSSVLFFLTITVFFTNPFRYISSPFIPPDGNGLNPLLQNPYMAIHPPALYLGFTMLAVPYAFCMGALFSGFLSNEWIHLTKRWTLAGWSFLTAGIMLGGHWAYLELGWGGFWAWDPVENASFLPWLTATAFLHSVMIQERKDMLRFWNVWLIVLSYGLTVFGTFLTRSGIVQSVHAFASTDVGEVFLQYLASIFILAAVLTWYRRKELKSSRHIESFFSREAAFLVNNLLFLSICFATLWGVMFPILSEAVTGKKQTVGIPFFNAVNVPLFLAVLFMMGVGTLIAWKRASLTSLMKTFFWPFVWTLAIACLLVFVGITEFYPVLAYALSFFAIITVVGEMHRGASAHRKTEKDSSIAAIPSLFRRHRRRYAGYLVHTGAALCAISITASMAHKTEKEFSLSPGESFEIGRFTLTLEKLSSDENDNFQSLMAIVPVYTGKDQTLLTTLRPEKRIYIRSEEPTTEVALRMGPREDLYLILAGLGDRGEAAFKVFINPLQMWLWLGGLVMLGGSLLILIPGFAPASSRTTVSAPNLSEVV